MAGKTYTQKIQFKGYVTYYKKKINNKIEKDYCIRYIKNVKLIDEV